MKNNQKYIIRCDRSGVFYGEIEDREDRNARLTNVRQVCYWTGAANLIQMACEGLRESGQRITQTAKSIVVTDVIEVIPCSDEAIALLDKVPDWKA